MNKNEIIFTRLHQLHLRLRNGQGSMKSNIYVSYQGKNYTISAGQIFSPQMPFELTPLDIEVPQELEGLIDSEIIRKITRRYYNMLTGNGGTPGIEIIGAQNMDLNIEDHSVIHEVSYILP